MPGDARFDRGNVFLESGHQYIVEFSLRTLKPKGAPGLALYFAVSFRCQDADGTSIGSIGGTKNLLPGNAVTMQNQMILNPASSEVYSCGVYANSPYDDIAAVGTALSLRAEWRLVEVGAAAAQAPTDRRLPVTIAPGSRENVMVVDLPMSRVRGRELSAAATAHMTTCTGINGSREHGRTWCSKPVIDRAGSDVLVTLSADATSAGKACARIGALAKRTSISRLRHHELLHLELETISVPRDACGDRVRLTVTVQNSGPAALVVHETNSSLIGEAR